MVMTHTPDTSKYKMMGRYKSRGGSYEGDARHGRVQVTFVSQTVRLGTPAPADVDVHLLGSSMRVRGDAPDPVQENRP